MSDLQRDAMLKRMVSGMQKTLLDELGSEHGRWLAGGRVLLVNATDEQTLVMLNALINVSSALIAAADDSYKIYMWFTACLADNVRRIDEELNCAEGKTLQ
jgi:hypothetical protein